VITREKLINDFRIFLKKEKLDAFIVNSTDEYLNEYVCPEKNSRYFLTGFSGSTGDAIITQEELFLFVDGRYHLQAEIETDPAFVTVVKTGLDKSPQKALYEKLAELCGDKANIGIVSSKTSYAGFKELLKITEGKDNINLIEYEKDPPVKTLDINEESASENLRHVPLEISGSASAEKLELIKIYKTENGIDFLLITDLADIAYLTNLRGKEIQHSSCFKAKALIFDEKAYIFTNLKNVPAEILEKFDKDFVFKEENEFKPFIRAISLTEEISNVCCCPQTTSLAVFRSIEKLSDKIIEIKDSCISSLRSIKNIQELDYMEECYLKTDRVISRAISWLNSNLDKGMKISEKDFSDKVKSMFFEEGAYDLSFETIAARGKNTAFIHYTNPDPNKMIEKGELVLLDCGSLFEWGYATDATRTFLAGGSQATADKMQKQVYTAVLKGFLQGINFELTENKTGFDLDSSVREILNANKPAEFNFSHATGHGVGILVHEFPPKIGSSECAKVPLEPGMCFTVEPGLYNEKWGGVRIENTVKVAEKNGNIKIKTLTRVGLDENLINYEVLTDEEKTRLIEYNRQKIS